MKPGTKVIIFLVALFLPLAARAVWFCRGVYRPEQLPQLSEGQLALPTSEYKIYTDQPQAGDGRVIIDTAHTNILDVDDLTPLKERLAARSVQVLIYDGFSSALEDELRGASAFVTAVPASEFSSFEQGELAEFVRSGGKLLLIADPTRFAFSDPLIGLPPESAYPAINSLGNAFGVVFYDDYLYNQVDNAGNYRIVRYREFAENISLVSGLDSLILPSAGSIHSQGTALIQGDENTRSNLRQGAQALTPVMLAADGQVLALGDLTFLTPQFHTLADNDRFLSNIADWLAVDTRQRGLRDFPFLFKGPVELVQLLDDTVDPYLVASSSPLLAVFDQEGIPVTLKEEAAEGMETIYLGTFDRLDEVQDTLDAAGVTVDLPAAETESTLEEPESSGEVGVEGMGTFLAQGSGLLVVDRSEGIAKVIVLAQDRDSVLEMVGRLANRDFIGCAEQGEVLLCSTGEATYGFNSEQGDQSGGGETASILIISVDNRVQGARTGTEELGAALNEFYQVTIWSTSIDGIPTSDDLSGYDAYIVNSGDYAFTGEDQFGFDGLFSIEGPVMYLGEQPLPPEALAEPPAELLDVQVVDSAHPLVAGFQIGPVIDLLPSESGVPALVLSPGDLSADPASETSVVMARGPQSPGEGSPVLVARAEAGQQSILALFSFYRLPEELQATFALNAASWLLGE